MNQGTMAHKFCRPTLMCITACYIVSLMLKLAQGDNAGCSCQV
jgi:hypothetical protein